MRKDIPTSLKLVETNKDSWCVYIINDDVALYIRYRSPRKANNHLSWNFSFDKKQLTEIREYLDKSLDLKITLICINGEYKEYKSEICLLNKEQFLSIIDIHSITNQRINVYLENRKSFRVCGTKSKNSEKIIVNRCEIDKIKIHG
ncbi:hypothetical protein [Clostridium fallax]|uniref:hypothetical protein n=1 Tax=Clostridium fallax TaxID=1533 RepID=UPI00155A019D|nr:hypothetical protein [Clostridium fallax]